jgi:hypothetical protein
MGMKASQEIRLQTEMEKIREEFGEEVFEENK